MDAGQELVEAVGFDVAAADQDHGPPAADRARVVEQRGDGRRGRGLAHDAEGPVGVDDRLADLPRARFLSLMPTVFAGTHVHQPVVEVVRARSVEISASRPFTVYADGDPIAELPARIDVLPGAMRVVVPAAAPAPSPWTSTDRSTADHAR